MTQPNKPSVRWR